MRRLKEKIIFALLVLAVATPVAAHMPPPELAPAVDLRHQATAQELVQPFPVFAGTTAFEELAHVALPPPSIADELARRFAASDVESRSDLAIFDRTVSQKLASGPLAVFDENNFKEQSELGPKLRRTIGNARARWYDPSTGSFLSPDPKGYIDASNLYAFAGGDPVNGRDPTGEACLGLFGSGTCADLANAGKKKLDEARVFVDKHSGSTLVDVAVNAQFGFALDAVDTFVLDPLRFGDATGEAIGRGADAVDTALAVVQDVGRAASLAAAAGTVVKTVGRGVSLLRAATNFDEVGAAAARGLDDGAALAARELTPAISNTAAQEQRIVSNIAKSAAARGASNFPTTSAATEELTDITGRAAAITDRLIQNNSTYWARVHNNPALRGKDFADAFAANPNFARSLIRGNIMDDVAKQLAQKTNLPFMRATPRGARGADFINLFLNSAWDVTTAGSWARHVSRYAAEAYRLYPLIY